MEKEDPTSRSDPIERSHFLGPVNYMIFERRGGYPIHVYESLSKSVKNLLLMLDRSVFTAYENIDSTLWEEPPKAVTLYENLGLSYGIDDPE